MALTKEPQTLAPLEPQKTAISLTTLGDALTYNISGWDKVLLQADPETPDDSWTASATFGVTLSAEEGKPYYNPLAGAVTLSGFGAQLVTVVGFKLLRIKNTAVAASGAVRLRPTVRAIAGIVSV